jgi:uncharacterized protein (DUF305 family)
MHRKSLMLMLLGIIAAWLLAACGQGTEAPGTAQSGGTEGSTVQITTPAPTTAPPTTAAATPTTMDHSGAMGHSMGTSDAPLDAQFIDSMIEHHRGAVTMAEQALKEGEHPEIKQLAQAIIAAQEQEINQMTTWRQEWYPDLAPTTGMGMDMGDMEISNDASIPFDQRFITAMISHHQGALEMAEGVQDKAEHPEIKELAAAIITAQKAEIAQMEQWQREWFSQ